MVCLYGVAIEPDNYVDNSRFISTAPCHADKIVSRKFPTVRLQPQQICDDNPCFINEENFSWCVCMVSQSSPVTMWVTRGLSALRHVTLL